MITAPHDAADLMLAPTALALDQQLDQLAELAQDELAYLVALATDRQSRTPEGRADLLLMCLLRDVPTHGWDVSWHARGLRVGHGTRQVVLGLPASVRTFLAA